MELQIDAPLKWPAHILQTERLSRGYNPSFSQNMSEQDAIRFLQEEVNLTDSLTSAKLTCNAMNINSPMPTQYISKHPGASVILRIADKTYTLCCDRWLNLAHNIYALSLALRQFRQIEQWGVGSLPVLLLGFGEDGVAAAHDHAASFTAAGGSEMNWRHILGLGTGATLEDANAIYRTRAKAVGEHDPDALQQLNLAIQEARRFFGA